MKNGKNIGKYIPTKPSNMEPLMPSMDDELLSISAEISERIGRLKEKLHPITAKSVAAILADMNSYYSNLIEGHHTYPREIERAINNDLSDNPDERAKQLLGLAHVKTEKQIMEGLIREKVFSIDFIAQIHKTFYGYLPENMRFSNSASGEKYRINPGRFRDFEVSVGRHQPGG